jgi:AbiV family abortive infection protein
MRKSKADPYRGPLSPFQIADGIAAAKRNARRLLEDATALYDSGRHPSATSLAALSIEELGKLPILRRMALATTLDEWRICWRDFANHTAKSAQWSVPFFVKQAETPEELFAAFGAERDPVLLDSLKQFGFYLGCYGRAHWAEPHHVIDKGKAELVLYAARALAAGSMPSALDSPTAVQRWSESLRGCFRCTAVHANDRVVEFLKTARGEGMGLEGEGISPGVAFEFMSTVLYLSGDDTAEGSGGVA